ncbi:MAG: CoA transferase [Deltaproteobacteria bacterium]|nr:CoA transferase [Deltaproteobacteria bacterium]MBW2084939.1 CoA transferase [Deltaproteobacteria bacterium]
MLKNIRVLDFSRVLSGPFCTRMLADLGAEVIKAESLNGDLMRQAPPFKGKFASYFTQFNLGKKSISVNLQHEKGIDLIKKLAAKCDVVIENFRPGLMTEMGLGYPVLRAINPDIIYCSISGFGQTGPEAKRPAYTDIIEAYSGLDYAAGEMYGSDGTPPGFPFSLGDTYASLNATIAILAALYHRELTGEGQLIDISMLDCILAANDSTLQKYIFSDGEDDIPTLVFRPPLKMKDGYMAASIALGFERTVQAIGRPELLEDECFKTLEARSKHFDIFIQVVKEWAQEKTIEEASEIFNKFDIPYSKVNSTAEIINSPIIRERKMLVDVELPGVGSLPIVNTPFKFFKNASQPQGPPPLLGGHNQEVFGELLGLSESELDQLTREGVISQEEAP